MPLEQSLALASACHQTHVVMSLEQLGYFNSSSYQSSISTRMLHLILGMKTRFFNAGGTVVNVSSTLGTLKNLSPKYQRYVTDASSIKELSKMPHIHDDPIKNIMVPCYSLTKAMMNRMTQLLAADSLLTSRKITLNCVCPGWCRYVIPAPLMWMHHSLRTYHVRDPLAQQRHDAKRNC